MNATETATPKVWIACLAAYNNGRLHGKWVDATDADELREAKDKILATSPIPGAEEWAIHDYDGFGDLASTLGEYASFEQVAKIGALIEEHGVAFIAFVSACEPDLDEVDEDDFYHAFQGKFDSEREFAEQHVGELGFAGLQQHDYVAEGDYEGRSKINPLEALDSYLDWDHIARELFLTGYTSVRTSGGVFVFDDNA